MPRSAQEGKASKKPNDGKKISSVSASDNRVYIINDEVINYSQDIGVDEARPTFCKLRHPRMNSGVLFLISADCTNVYELNSFEEKFRSWFVGDTIQSDGQIMLTTRMDPLFLVLPYLINAGQSRFMSLDQLIYDEDFPECHKLLTCCSHDQLDLLCDWKDVDDNLQVYRYNKDKTLSWLKSKVETLADTLAEKQINVSSQGSQSAIFVRGKKSLPSRESLLQFAHGIVGDYLPVALKSELQECLQLPELSVTTPGGSCSENEPPAKKIKLGTDVTPTEDYSSAVKKDKAKTGKLTTAQKRLSKVDKTGMKSISSFFAAK